MSIQYMVPGFELMTFGHESPPITTRPGPHPCASLFVSLRQRHNSLPLVPIQPSSPSNKELHAPANHRATSHERV